MLGAKFLLSGLALAALTLPGQTMADEQGGHAVSAGLGAGETVYQDICKACHMADGKGAEGAAVIPALAGDPRLAAPAYPVLLVLNGRGAMPGFRDLLSPSQIADVANYVRENFGNRYPTPVTANMVETLSRAPH